MEGALPKELNPSLARISSRVTAISPAQPAPHARGPQQGLPGTCVWSGGPEVSCAVQPVTQVGEMLRQARVPEAQFGEIAAGVQGFADQNRSPGLQQPQGTNSAFPLLGSGDGVAQRRRGGVRSQASHLGEPLLLIAAGEGPQRQFGH